MKKLTILLLCVVMLFSACAGNTAPVKTPDETDTEGDISLTITDNAANIPEPTQAPTPVPTLYPDNGTVKETSDYGFVYSDTSVLRYAPDRNAPVAIELAANAELTITGKIGEWYRADYNGTVGYIEQMLVAFSSGYINAVEVNLRDTASRSSNIIMKTEMNTELVVLDRKDEWVHVVLKDAKNTQGYMHTDYVSYIDAYVTDSNVTLRESPDASSKDLGELKKGKRVSLMTQHGEWVKVLTDKTSGYVKATTVQSAPIVVKLERARGYILESGVHIREGAAIGFSIVDTLSKYASIYITGETDEWYRIEYNKVCAYIMKDFVEKGTPSVYVTGQDVNLRSGPDTDSDLLTKVRQNSEFIIISCKGDWYKGEVCGNVGYIRGDYLDTKKVGNGKRTNEFTEAEIYLAAKVVYLEARDNGMDAYRAVANAIYNRVKSHMFPNTVKGVVYQPHQYTVINHSKFNTLTPSSQALTATRQVLNQGLRPLPANVTFFFASYLGRHWGNDKDFYKVIGDNAFFRYVG